MSSEKTPHPVWQYFRYDRETDKSHCLVLNCLSKPFEKRHSGNVLQHLERYHKEQFNVVKAALLKRKQDQDDKKAPPPKKRKVEQIINVKMDSRLLMDACVSLVAISGMPLRLMRDPGMRMIIDPILKGLQNSVAISPKTVADEIKRKAEDLRKVLRKEFENRLICIKLDGAKRLSRSVVGINVQFIENGKVQLRNLATVELKERQTGLALKKIVENTADEFGIRLRNLYSATTDNGANVLLAIRLLAAEQEQTVEVLTDDDVVAGGKTFIINILIDI